MTKNLSTLDIEIEAIKQKVGSVLELPDEKWIRQSGPFESVQQFFDSSFKNFKELLYFTNITPSQRVLDYGCGLARLAIPCSGYLKKTGGSYCGIDTDKSCVARNSKVFGHLPNFELHHVDIYSKMYNRTGRAPGNSRESAILITLQPGTYTAILDGVGGGTGAGIVEVFDLTGR